MSTKRKIRTDSLLSQEYILDALSKMLNENIPFSEITVTELCKRAGVARITFYKYYDSISSAYDKLLEKRFVQFLHRIEFDPENNLLEIYEQSFILVQPYAVAIKNIVNNGKIDFLYQTFYKNLKNVFHVLSAKEEKIHYTAFVSGLFYVAVNWVLDGMQETPEQLANEVYRWLPIK